MRIISVFLSSILHNYPYNHPSSTSPSVGLVSGCRYLEVDGIPNAEIGCRLVKIKNFGNDQGARRCAARQAVPLRRVRCQRRKPAPTHRRQRCHSGSAGRLEILEEPLDLRQARHPRRQRLQL